MVIIIQLDIFFLSFSLIMVVAFTFV